MVFGLVGNSPQLSTVLFLTHVSGNLDRWAKCSDQPRSVTSGQTWSRTLWHSKGFAERQEVDPKLTGLVSISSRSGEGAAASRADVFSPDLDSFNILDVFLNDNKQRNPPEFLSFILLFILLVFDGDILVLQCPGGCVFCVQNNNGRGGPQ